MGTSRGGPSPQAISLPKQTKRTGKKATLNLSERNVGAFVCMTFGAVSVATKHKHWRKTPEQVKPIVEPLTEWLNTLPAEIIEKFEKYAPWVLTLYGCSQVIVPDVLIELELRRMENERRMGGVSGTYGPAQTSGTAAAPVPAGNPETPPANPAVVAPSPDL